MSLQRISVVGSSGSGKSTYGAALAGALGYPFVELDALHWKPNWTETSDTELLAELRPLLDQSQWVIDGNYGSLVQKDVWERADTVVWLNLSRWTVMRSVTQRTLKRMVTREELWNGNREDPRNLFSLNPSKNLIVWTWTRYDGYVARYFDAMSDPEWSHLEFVRLRSRSEMGEYLAGLRGR